MLRTVALRHGRPFSIPTLLHRCSVFLVLNLVLDIGLRGVRSLRSTRYWARRRKQREHGFHSVSSVIQSPQPPHLGCLRKAAASAMRRARSARRIWPCYLALCGYDNSRCQNRVSTPSPTLDANLRNQFDNMVTEHNSCFSLHCNHCQLYIIFSTLHEGSGKKRVILLGIS